MAAEVHEPAIGHNHSCRPPVNEQEVTMGRYPIVTNPHMNDTTETFVIPLSTLPANYMSDFTVLGLHVSRCDDATVILEENDFRIIRSATGAEVILETPGQVRLAVDTLHARGIGCEVADVAQTLYQG
jgi:hypothetical protein